MPVIAAIVQQHVEDAAHLRLMRSRLVRASNVSLRQLARHDERLAAHLDGIAVAGEYGEEQVQALLESPWRGEFFTVAVRALESGRHEALEPLYALGEASNGEAVAGLLSALGWVSPASLRGVVRQLLESRHPARRAWGLAACAMHEVEAGPALAAALGSDDKLLRWRALQVAVERGQVDLLEACAEATRDADPDLACRAAHACVMLGERGGAVERLAQRALDPSTDSHLAAEALRTVLRVIPAEPARALLARLARSAAPPLSAVRAVGVAGDPHYLPWLLEQMRLPGAARAAAESFATITGIDLHRFDLEERPAASADEDDAAPDSDEDADLPWPDVERIAGWWQANSAGFTPDTRCFMGQPPSPSHCLQVLATGFQRQRIAAAQYLSLLTPGTPLFNTRAPAWRQKRLLARMAGGAGG